VFVVESEPGRVKVLRGAPDTDSSSKVETFATGLVKPFGIAFYPPGPNPTHLYIGNTDSVVRFPYRNGDLKASGPSEMIVENLPGGGRLRGGGHWTRDVRFSNDGKQERIFASGIRNAVGLAVHPRTGELWASVNERDTLGDHLVPDYVTHVQEGGFYGWPWYYMGGHADERATEPRPDLKDKVITPDVLVQSHSASLGMALYTGRQFPAEYALDAFAAEHGSWNRTRRTGYKVIRIPMKNGKATGEYEDFMTGFVTPEGQVWGRPVGVTVGGDGSLFVSDDASGAIWRVQYSRAANAAR
jgi:glucose/arabinose dehydrogenase